MPQFHCARKLDVVLQMNVLVEILLEVSQAVIKSVVRGASVSGCREVVAQAPNLGKQRSSCIMLLGHHRDQLTPPESAAHAAHCDLVSPWRA